MHKSGEKAYNNMLQKTNHDISLGGRIMSNLDGLFSYTFLYFPILHNQYIILLKFEITTEIMFLEI